MFEDRLKLYKALIDKCPRFEHKGKSMHFTSANGYMFSILNKDGEIGIRFSKETQKKYLEEFNTSLFKSYGSVMRGYVLIPDTMLADLDAVAKYLDESYDWVMSLEEK